MVQIQVGGEYLLVDSEGNSQIQVGGEYLLVDSEGNSQIRVGGEYLLADVEGNSQLQLAGVYLLVDAEILDPALAVVAAQRTNQPVREKIVATPMSPRTAAPSTLS